MDSKRVYFPDASIAYVLCVFEVISLCGELMEHLSEAMSLRELQDYVRATEQQRGFDQEEAIHKCLLLGEEVGELFKAVRRVSSLKMDPGSSVHEIGEELADILNFILAIANRFDLSLSEEYVRKETMNRRRSWVPLSS